MENILRKSLVTYGLKNAGSGTTDLFTSLLDMQGFNSCRFIAIQTSGASTAGNTLGVYHTTVSTADSTSNGLTLISTGCQLSSPVTTGKSKGLLQIEVIRPQKRYVAGRFTRTTATAHAGIICERFQGMRLESSTKSSTDDLTTALLYHPQSTGSTST